MSAQGDHGYLTHWWYCNKIFPNGIGGIDGRMFLHRWWECAQCNKDSNKLTHAVRYQYMKTTILVTWYIPPEPVLHDLWQGVDNTNVDHTIYMPSIVYIVTTTLALYSQPSSRSLRGRARARERGRARAYPRSSICMLSSSVGVSHTDHHNHPSPFPRPTAEADGRTRPGRGLLHYSYWTTALLPVSPSG